MYLLRPMPKFPVSIIQTHPVLLNILMSCVLYDSEYIRTFPNAGGVAWIWIRIGVILELDLSTNLHESGAIITQGERKRNFLGKMCSSVIGIRVNQPQSMRPLMPPSKQSPSRWRWQWQERWIPGAARGLQWSVRTGYGCPKIIDTKGNKAIL